MSSNLIDPGLIIRIPSRTWGVLLDCSTRIATLFLALVLLSQFKSTLQAQVPVPDRTFVFREDAKEAQALQRETGRATVLQDVPLTDTLDLKAPKVEFLKDKEEVKGSGGILLSRGGITAQAEETEVNLQTQDADLQGRVVISGEQGSIVADSGSFNMESELGDFTNAELNLEDGAYQSVAGRLEKLSDTEYQLFDCRLTTCACEGECILPWKLTADRAHLTRDGYAHTYGTTFRFFDVPIFYTPYLGFPIKEQRQSGLLVPSFGYGSKDGFQYTQPIFIDWNESRDFTLNPFIESRTRNGGFLDYREAFSRFNNTSGRFLYSNERPRDGDLRGTITDGLFDPTFDEDRVAGYYNQLWQSSPGSALPTTFLADLRYVSDDLLLREFDNQAAIGEYNSRYTTSKLLLRSAVSTFATAEVYNEYSQSLLTDDDLVFQRLPELRLSGIKSFRPLGFNPYGLKLNTKATVQSTRFDREDGFDGWRTSIAPGVSVPFNVSNYFNGSFSTNMVQNFYNLDDQTLPGSDYVFDETNSLQAYSIGYSMSTVLERVYQLEPDSWLTTLAGLGAANQAYELKRVKHTIEPLFQYNFVPKTYQDDLPLFDAQDRLRHRSLITYGFTSRLIGRYLPEYSGADGIVELTPRVEELPVLNPGSVLPGIGETSALDAGALTGLVRHGTMGDLATLTVLQSYDYAIDRLPEPTDGTEELDALSDLSARVALLPSSSLGLQLDTNYNVEDQDVSSWGLTSAIFSDRGDAARARVSYVEESISQLEANLELVVVSQLRLGYYTRWDEREREFIENKATIRLLGSDRGAGQDCWKVDLSYGDQINPDRQNVYLTFTFRGLGDITSGVWGRALNN